jgi:hypothetical protein
MVVAESLNLKCRSYQQRLASNSTAWTAAQAATVVFTGLDTTIHQPRGEVFAWVAELRAANSQYMDIA